MITRFLVIWLVIAAVIYVTMFVATKRDRQAGGKITFRLIVSGVLAALAVSFIFLINNISGV